MNQEAQRLFFSGDSLEQAVLSAARHYACDPDELLYERVEKRHGFIRTRRRVVIRVDPDHFRRPEGVPAGNLETAPAADRPETRERRESQERRAPPPAPSRERHEPARRSFDRPSPAVVRDLGLRPLHERFPRASAEQSEAAREALVRLFDLGGLDLDAAVFQGEERLEIDLSGADGELVRDDEAHLLQALQHLLPRMMQATLGELVPCRVDSENHQEIRQERLRELARDAAAEVLADRRPLTLRPMSPADRRIVHLTLADDPALVTESRGEGYYRRVTIRQS